MSDVTEKGQTDQEPTTSTAEQLDQTDNDFEPSADQLVHDFDDEQTMEEEENMSAESEGEIDNLLKEGDMPIEELLAMYGRSQDNFAAPLSEDGGFNSQENTQDASDLMDDDLDDDDYNGSDEDDNDDDYTPALDEYWKKDIRIGDEYQVEIPDTAQPFVPEQPPTESHAAVLLWDPEGASNDQVELYLRSVKNPSNGTSIQTETLAVIPDEEQALYVLLQNEFDAEAALAKNGEAEKLPQDPLISWTEEECQNFEAGLRMFGKNFFAIHQNKVKNRSVGELVKFYYFWKKTERRDAFADLGKLDKRKFNLNPGTTDYSDRYGDQTIFDDVEPAALEQSCDCSTVKPPPDTPAESGDAVIVNHVEQIPAINPQETGKLTDDTE